MKPIKVRAEEVRDAFRKDAAGRERFWAPMQTRAVATTSDGIRMGGLAAVFGAEARVRLRDGRPAVERVGDAAFNNTLKRGDIFLLWQHEPSEPMARTGAGNLDLRASASGLEWDAFDMPATQRVRDAALLLESGVIDKMSFGFTVPPGGDSIEVRADGSVVRTLHDVRLAEISLVTWPAYEATSASVRADAFGLLCRQLQLDESEVLRLSLEDDTAFGMLSMSAVSQRAESGAETTSTPGAETTSEDPQNLRAGNTNRLMRELRLRALSSMDLPKETDESPGTFPGREAGRGL